MTITEIKESICDNYCKYPFNTETQAELNEHCRECPLNELEPCEYSGMPNQYDNMTGSMNLS